jgi:hypothetical protein
MMVLDVLDLTVTPSPGIIAWYFESSDFAVAIVVAIFSDDADGNDGCAAVVVAITEYTLFIGMDVMSIVGVLGLMGLFVVVFNVVVGGNDGCFVTGAESSITSILSFSVCDGSCLLAIVNFVG